ncbi:related to null pigmentation protein NpgA [Cephalotrichum gorgonifer]|uniref:holo-[acyl-carrier-protein] synthase n=1 Tax=Cephalotrichum gorgonifer TaxID=2041049 RepID=A0AAE8N2F8_9PEZI|nr:related to null pigmentation protein NpgA [Cephalotrichum gorgonifer]
MADDEARVRVRVLQWIVNTRNLFPEATETKHLETVAAPYLALLPPPDRASALKYLFPRDAKLSLASSLLKRHAISVTASPTLPWSAITPTRDAQGKPVFVSADGSSPVSFNVSHQDGLVALFGVAGCPADVGVDVVSCTERQVRDREAVRAGGWPAFVDVYESVYSTGEMAYLKSLDGRGLGIDQKLRYFYALWCLKEAYVKMTGEALLADWLLSLEFRNFHPPAPVAAPMAGGDLSLGEVVREIEVFRDGKRDAAVRMELRSLGAGYMVGVAVRTPERVADAFDLDLGDFEFVTLEEIRERAEGNP